jgi:hypothetical protein
MAIKFARFNIQLLGSPDVEIKAGIALDITDLKTFDALEEIAEKKFNWCISDEKVKIARKSASERLGVKFLDFA